VAVYSSILYMTYIEKSEETMIGVIQLRSPLF